MRNIRKQVIKDIKLLNPVQTYIWGVKSDKLVSYIECIQDGIVSDIDDDIIERLSTVLGMIHKAYGNLVKRATQIELESLESAAQHMKDSRVKLYRDYLELDYQLRIEEVEISKQMLIDKKIEHGDRPWDEEERLILEKEYDRLDLKLHEMQTIRKNIETSSNIEDLLAEV